MSIEQMRNELLGLYPGEAWRLRVMRMPPNQVLAIYKRMLEGGKDGRRR